MRPATRDERPVFEGVPRLHGDVSLAQIQLHAEPRRQTLLPDAGRQDQSGFRAARVVRTLLWLSAGRRATGAAEPDPGRTTPKLRPS